MNDQRFSGPMKPVALSIALALCLAACSKPVPESSPPPARPSLSAQLQFLEDLSLRLAEPSSLPDHREYCTTLIERSGRLLNAMPEGRERNIFRAVDLECQSFSNRCEWAFESIETYQKIRAITSAAGRMDSADMKTGIADARSQITKSTADLKEKAREAHRLLLTELPK